MSFIRKVCFLFVVTVVSLVLSLFALKFRSWIMKPENIGWKFLIMLGIALIFFVWVGSTDNGE